MNTPQFNEFVERVIEHIRKSLLRKGEEYGSDDDRFYNFKVAVKLEPPPENHPYLSDEIQALKGMQLKHKVSVYDLNTGKLQNTDENLFEKFGDEICYLILNMGMLTDIRKEGIGVPKIERLRTRSMPQPVRV